MLARRAADRKSVKEHLEHIWRAGVGACLPERVLPPHLPTAPRGRTIVLAVGKAALGMARVAERRMPGEVSGIAVVPHGVEAVLQRIEPVHAGHPLPDEASVGAAERLLALASSAGPDDLVLVLLSGGGSALACLPGDGLRLRDKQRLTRALLDSGASIGEFNCVRRHLSRIKGGRLGLAAGRTRLVTLAISDARDDCPEAIGSGPTVADPTTLEDAFAVLERHGIAPLELGWAETPKHVAGSFRIVANGADALAAAAGEARRLGYRPEILGECHGDAYRTGAEHGEAALRAAPETALISGGELSSPVRGAGGMGGRNHVYALAAATRIQGRSDIAGLAADTDGLDGSSGAAGAFFDGTTRRRSRRDGAEAIEAGNSGRYFQALGDQLVTGATGTNVNDLRIILVAG